MFYSKFFLFLFVLSENLYSQKQQKTFGTFIPKVRYVREKIRTPDTLVRSQVLYPAELRTHIKLSWSPRMPATGIEPVLYCYNRILSPARLPVPPRRHVILSGTNRARTYDPLLVRQMLSQLSYDPISVLLSDPSGTRTRDLRRDRAAL